ncbi:PKD domain-containing protein [Deferrisoma camini]|uniref:PKD domain-containing protein n=1 Tax=Deferrisoma camini TaxID=1035120 RepID=UPI00046D1047|nr:PKD domain-containing protein [Deferrisoma camini]
MVWKLPTIGPVRGAREGRGVLSQRMRLGLISLLVLAAAGCGGGGGGSGGTQPSAASTTESALTVSGTVRDLSSAGAARLARSELSAVENAVVRVSVDLDGDGLFAPETEVFTVRTDESGGFVVSLPAEAEGKTVEVRVEKPGYSTFVKRYEDVEGSILMDPVLSEGAVAAVDLDGVSASPARAGRVVLDTDRTVTVSLVRDRATGRRAARVFWGSEPSPFSGAGQELARMSFSLRGLELPAGTQRLYASVAYLDTANDPDTMPGGFKAEGSGDSPVEVLSTYAASEITLYDELGNKLLTDPTDRDRDIRIRIAIPAEAYETLVDEDPETPEVEIPLFYYDEAAGTWRLHRTADGSPAYGHLEDPYGNVLTQDDLARLRAGDDTDTPVFGVGTVHHFTTWNCDRSGYSVSYHARLRDRNGNRVKNVSVRVRTRRGGRTSDYSNRPDPNLHTYRAATADSIIRRVLDRSISAEERSRYLYAVMHSKNPDALTALLEALRRYEENQMVEISSEESEFKRGLMDIFRRKEINDAFINTEGLDCSKTPDLCKGAVAAAAEAVNRSSKAKQVTAFLMQIAVDAYNPTNLDFEYAATKGLEFLDVVANTDGVAQELGEIPGQIKSAKELASQALQAYRAYKKGTGSWRDFWNLAKQLRETMENIKSLASTLGSRLNRRVTRAAPLTEPDPQTPEEEAAAVDDVADEVLASYDELGGLLLGASHMRRYQWGYFDDQGEFHPVEDWPGKPEYVGGDAVVMLEYYDGTDWVPLEGRSDLGVDASFIPVPTVTSFGPGSPQAPALYLGTWTLDLEPNVTVQGLVQSKGGAPLPDVPVVVAGTELRTGPDGRFEGEISWFSDSTWVPYQLPSFGLGGSGTLREGALDLGTIEVQDQVTVDYGNVPWLTRLRRGESLTVRPDEWAGSASGRTLAISYALYRGWVSDESVPIEEGSGESFSFTVADDVDLGRYTLRVTLSVADDDTVPPRVVDLGIDVQSTPPSIDALTLSADEVQAGSPVVVSLDASDPDGDDTIRSRNITLDCSDEAGTRRWLAVRAEPDGTWSIGTDPAYTLLEGTLRCVVIASVTDRTWLTDRETAEFTVEPNPVPPEVAGGGLDDEYVVSLYRAYDADTDGWQERVDVWMAGRVWFRDPNGDLDHFELDCGNGESPAEAASVWDLPACRYTDPGDFAVTYKAVDSRGLETALTTTVHVLYPLRFEVSLPEDALHQDEDGNTWVELPAGDAPGLDVTVQVKSDNGPGGYEEGGGSIAEGTYSVTYRSGNRWWWSETIAWNAELPEDGAIPLVLDKPGSYTVSVWAQDARGMSASLSRVIEVTAPFDGELRVNGDPLDAFAASGGWVLVGDEVALSVEVTTQPDDADLRFRWLVDGVDQGEGTSPAFTYTPDTEGEHTVRVEIRNAQETAEAHKVVREVSFQAYSPVLLEVGRADGVDEPTARAGDVVTLGAAVPEGVEVAEVRWSVDGPEGGFRPVPTDDPLQAAWTFAEAGSYTVRVEAEDSRGVVSTATYAVTVTADPPVIHALTADPASGRPPLEVTFAADAEDPDAREGESLYYRWFVDGEPVSAGTASTFTHAFEAEATHTVRVEVTDAGGLTASSSVPVLVQDRPPTIVSVRVEPGSGVAPLDVTATAEADDDGEITGYAWYLDDEPIGSGATLSHTFQDPGTYTLTAEVTDDAGQSSTKSVTVYVLDPDEAGVVFQFKEVRSDGLGPEVDFDALSDVIGHGGGLWFASTPVDDPAVNSEDLQGLSSQLTFAGPAFYGFHGESWGNVSDTLVQIETPGTYEVGLDSWETGSSRTVRFPAAYSCGLLLYGQWPRNFGYWGSNVDSPLSSLDIEPLWAFTTSDGRVNLLAMLGQWNDSTYTCDYEYFGFKSSGEDAFSLGETDAVALRSLEIASPAGIQVELSDVAILVDGMELRFGETHELPQDDQGRVQIPVVPGADYVLEFAAPLDDGSYWTVEVPLDADTVGASDPVPVDLSGLDPESPLGLENAPPGYLRAEVVGASGIRVRSMQSVSEGAAATGSVLTVQDESTVHLMFDGTDQRDGFGFYRSWAPEALPDPLDLAAPGVAVTVSDPEITVDTEGKTVTVRYQASNADACAVDVDVEFDTNGDGWADRTRWENYLTDGSITELTLGYPLPEMTVTYGGEGSADTQTYPATDAVSKVTARVTCMRLTGGYDAFVREVLREGGTLEEISSYGWQPIDLMEVPAVEEMAWKRTSWTLGPP